MFNDFEGSRLDERVGRNDDSIDPVIFNERVNDLRQIAPEHRLAAREPEVCDGRHGLRNLLDLLEGHIARTIQLFMIKAGLAEGVAARGDEKNQRAKALLAPCRAQELNELCGF